MLVSPARPTILPAGVSTHISPAVVYQAPPPVAYYQAPYQAPQAGIALGRDVGQGCREYTAPVTVGGRVVLVRFIITRPSDKEAHFEQAYSADGGMNWETNWFAVDTRR